MKIKYEEGTCSECGLPKLIVQKSLYLCAGCNAKRLSKIYRERKKQRYESGEKADKGKLNKFYKEVWEKSEKVCYETSAPLWTFHKWHVHHVLDKENYPELAFNSDICVLLTLEQHALWHSVATSDRKRKMPRTYKKYLELLKKYDNDRYQSEANSGVDAY